MMIRKYAISLLCIISLFVFPLSSFAQIKDISSTGRIWSLTAEEYGTTIPAGATGTFSLKTPSGATKFMPSEFEGKNLGVIDFRCRGCPLSNTFYMVSTTGAGVTNTVKSGGSDGSVGIDLQLGTKSVTIKIVVTAATDKERYVNIKQVDVLKDEGTTDPGNGGGGGTDPPIDPGDPDPGGTDPGGTDPGGTDPGGTDPSTCLCPELCTLLPEMLSGIQGQLLDLQDSLGSIKDAVAPIHGDLANIQQQLNAVNDNTRPLHGDLQTIHNDVAPLHGDFLELLRQLTPDQYYDVPLVNQPYPFQPTSIGDEFTDHEYYFDNPGSAAAPGAMPTAPEPKNWTIDGVELNQQPQGKRDQQKADPIQKADAQQQQDNAQKKDVTQQKEANQKADAAQHMEESQQAEPAQEADPDQTKDDAQQKDAAQQGTNQIQRDPALHVQSQNYPLRWDSSDYRP